MRPPYISRTTLPSLRKWPTTSWYLRYGNLIEERETRELLEHPKERYTRELLAVRTFRKNDIDEEITATPLLEVKNLTAAYGKQPVLHNVNVVVPLQRTVALVGESGSGKSTTARVISGLLRPREGQILWQGTPLPADFRQRTKAQLRRIQMIYQMPDTSLNPKQRVRETIGRPLSFYLDTKRAARDERVRELLSLVELEPNQYIDRLPSELSGGEKQRVCIARALAAEPELVICDEVTSALDQLVAEEVLKLLDRLQREFDLSYIFITHDIGTVRAIADDVVVMFQGKVVESGPKREMFVPPHHEYTDLLLASVPEMDPDWLDNLLDKRIVDATAIQTSKGESVD